MGAHQAANDNDIKNAASTPASIRRCPICGKAAVPDVRPFCSKRCADIDLHRWLGGNYAIPTADADDPDLPSDDPA